MKALAILAMTLFPFLAQAQVFVEGTIGQASADVEGFPGWDIDDKDTTWSLGAGYMFNRHFGIEASYRDLGEVKVSLGPASGTAEADGYTLGVRGVVPVTPKVDLMGHFGFFLWDVTERAFFNGVPSDSFSDDGNDPYFGVSAYYNVTPQLSVGGGWTRFDVNDSDADSLDLRVKYSF